MERQAPELSSNSEPGRGLPPVAPPSGRFIVQLFLVPGLIVAVVVLFWLGVRYMWGGAHTPDYFLRQLDSDNADIRWRGASDLAQVLKRTESTALRSDARFALDLAERLNASLDELDQAEKSTAERVKNSLKKEQELAWAKLAPQRDNVQYLAAALGDFVIPVGAPLLGRVALHDASPDLKDNTLQRRKAVWALGNLGENMKGFKALSAPEQTRILGVLREEAKGKQPRAGWAETALFYLDNKGRPAGTNVVEVDRVLARCARAADRYLRAQVALALNFWDSPRVDSILLELAHDDGHGTLIGASDAEDRDGR